VLFDFGLCERSTARLSSLFTKLISFGVLLTQSPTPFGLGREKHVY